LVTQQDGAPYASHLPLMLDTSKGLHGVLMGHMPRNNPHWQELASGAEVLVMFHGPHAYVSPSWYEPNPMVVPTWNYMAVHAYGVARIVSEDDLIQSLYQLTDQNEKSYLAPWKMELTQTMRDQMLNAMVGFEVSLSRIDGKFKMSQNRSQQDQSNVIAHLSNSIYGKDFALKMSKNLEGK
jgi:transcriptional regulator